MGLPDIYGIYGYSSVQYGRRVSESVGNLVTRIGDDRALQVYENCAILSGGPFTTGCQGNYTKKYPRTKDEILKPVTIASSMMLMSSSTISGVVPVISNYSTYMPQRGTTSSQPGQRISVGGGSIIIAEFDRSHYIGVIFVNARTELGQGINGIPLKTWKSQYAATYPYITSATMNTYYKQNFNDATLTTVTRLVGLLSAGVQRITYEYGRDTNGMVQYRRSGTYLAGRDPLAMLFQPDVSFSTINEEGEVHYYGTCNDSAINVPYSLLSFNEGVIGQETGNHLPFFYFTESAVMSAAASFGIPFATSYEDAQQYRGQATTNENIYIPGIDNNGYITDTLYNAGSIQDSIFYNWDTGGDISIYQPLGGTDLAGGTNVDPGINPPLTPSYEVQDPEPLTPTSTDMGLTAPSYNGVGMFASYFATSYAGILDLQNVLWTLSDNILVELVESLKLYNDPIQAVVSLRMYPFNLNQFISGMASSSVYFGKVELIPSSGGFLKMPNNARVIFDMGSIQIPRKYNNFLDLAPYTMMNLFIPFVGNVDLNVNDFLDHALRVQMTVDLTTGMCLAGIYADSILMMNVSGQMAVDIPVTSADSADIASRLFNALIGTAINATGGSVALAIGSRYGNEGSIPRRQEMKEEALDTAITPLVTGIEETIGDIFLGKTSMDRTGTSSPANSFYLPTYCFVTVSRPTFEKPPNYAKTYGKPCHTSGNCSMFSGYTVCNNVNVSGINALEYEKLTIKSILESGVYL